GGTSGLDDLLAPRLEIVETAIRDLEVALAAEGWRRRGALLEAARDPAGAYRAYQEALLLEPEVPAVRDGRRRPLAAMTLEAAGAAAGAMARGEWEAALGHLERLERILPGDLEVRKNADRCRRTLRDAILAEGARLRERGLPGNALLCFLRAR